MAKANKAEEYRSLDDQALSEQIENQEVQLKKLHFSHAVNPIENPLSIRALRRQIARLKTEQHKRALASK